MIEQKVDDVTTEMTREDVGRYVRVRTLSGNVMYGQIHRVARDGMFYVVPEQGIPGWALPCDCDSVRKVVSFESEGESTLQERAKTILDRYSELSQRGTRSSVGEFADRLGQIHNEAMELLREIAN